MLEIINFKESLFSFLGYLKNLKTHLACLYDYLETHCREFEANEGSEMGINTSNNASFNCIKILHYITVAIMIVSYSLSFNFLSVPAYASSVPAAFS